MVHQGLDSFQVSKSEETLLNNRGILAICPPFFSSLPSGMYLWPLALIVLHIVLTVELPQNRFSTSSKLQAPLYCQCKFHFECPKISKKLLKCYVIHSCLSLWFTNCQAKACRTTLFVIFQSRPKQTASWIIPYKKSSDASLLVQYILAFLNSSSSTK